ncbi:MAG: redox-regulated ATPase YchF [Anaerolineae bacterium]|nr:MAG: redox-regulated ATPase YchF [Anaerolineae bacterium]
MFPAARDGKRGLVWPPKVARRIAREFKVGWLLRAMRLGIIGLPGAGKTSIFNALTGTDLPLGGHAAHVEVHTGVADIPDPRLESLNALYQPRKTTHAQITFGDVAGLGQDGSLSGELVNQLAQWDGYLAILRAFEDPLTAAPPTPVQDLQAMEAEFLLNDLVRVEAHLERLAEDRQKGARELTELDQEADLFQRLDQTLQADRPLRDQNLRDADRELVQGFGLITTKPLLVVQNLEEGKDAQPLATDQPSFALYGKLEAELSQLQAEEAVGFRKEFGIAQAGNEGLMAACLDLLGVIRFYTVSESEVKAWLLPEGGTALQAAGAIHSDMARGFIRAEVIRWDDLVDFGGLSEARAAGKLRVEGKAYTPKDGEVIHIRFNV